MSKERPINYWDLDEELRIGGNPIFSLVKLLKNKGVSVEEIRILADENHFENTSYSKNSRRNNILQWLVPLAAGGLTALAVNQIFPPELQGPGRIFVNSLAGFFAFGTSFGELVYRQDQRDRGFYAFLREKLEPKIIYSR